MHETDQTAKVSFAYLTKIAPKLWSPVSGKHPCAIAVGVAKQSESKTSISRQASKSEAATNSTEQFSSVNSAQICDSFAINCIGVAERIEIKSMSTGTRKRPLQAKDLVFILIGFKSSKVAELGGLVPMTQIVVPEHQLSIAKDAALLSSFGNEAPAEFLQRTSREAAELMRRSKNALSLQLPTFEHQQDCV